LEVDAGRPLHDLAAAADSRRNAERLHPWNGTSHRQEPILLLNVLLAAGQRLERLPITRLALLVKLAPPSCWRRSPELKTKSQPPIMRQRARLRAGARFTPIPSSIAADSP